MLWGTVLVLALLFTLAAGRGWPIRPGPDFPKVDGEHTRPAAQATFVVYSPDARTMRLRTSFFVAQPDKRPPLCISLMHDGIVDTFLATTRLVGQRGLEAEVPLRLTRGNSTVRLTVGAPGSAPMAFVVGAVRVTQGILDAGSLRFCLVLAAVAASSILAARALGAGGINQFCTAPLIGFLLVTATATVLSPWHLLTGGVWAGVLGSASLTLGAWSVHRLAKCPPPALASAQVLRPWEAAVLLAVACPTFVLHIVIPVSNWDDLMYHGPRAAYWMENASALPFVAHDDRLSVFPIGGDLLFACGAILSGSELPGKFLGSLSLPLTLFAMFALLRNARVRSGVALGAVLVFATTPLITRSAIEIKPDLWLVLMAVITLHWVLTARRDGPAVPPEVSACLAAAGVGAALGIKWTAVPLFLLVPFAVWRPDRRWQSARPLLPAVVCAAALGLGGAGPILLFNLWSSHHPFGPAAMRQMHQPAPGVHPVAVQLKRLPFLFFGLPYLPGTGACDAVAHWELAAAEAMGATEMLWEEDGPWPGRFVPQVKQVDTKFSLGWVFVLAGGALGLCRWRRRGPDEGRDGFLLSLVLSLVWVVTVVTQTRWQNGAGVPERFFPPAYAFGLIAASWPASWLLGRRKLVTGLLGVLVVLHAVPYGLACQTAFRFGEQYRWKAPEESQTGLELEEVARLLPAGRTILLLADSGCRDYPLFRAREGFANRVLPWGKAAYDPVAFAQAVHRPGIDTVILVSADSLNLRWDPSIDARPFVRDMDARPEFSRLPGTGKIVVYVRGNSKAAPAADGEVERGGQPPPTPAPSA